MQAALFFDLTCACMHRMARPQEGMVPRAQQQPHAAQELSHRTEHQVCSSSRQARSLREARLSFWRNLYCKAPNAYVAFCMRACTCASLRVSTRTHAQERCCRILPNRHTRASLVHFETEIMQHRARRKHHAARNDSQHPMSRFSGMSFAPCM